MKVNTVYMLFTFHFQSHYSIAIEDEFNSTSSLILTLSFIFSQVGCKFIQSDIFINKLKSFG